MTLIVDPGASGVRPLRMAAGVQASMTANGVQVDPGASGAWATLLSSTAEWCELRELELEAADSNAGETFDIEILDGASNVVMAVQSVGPATSAIWIFAASNAAAVALGALDYDFSCGRSIVTRGGITVRMKRDSWAGVADKFAANYRLVEYN